MNNYACFTISWSTLKGLPNLTSPNTPVNLTATVDDTTTGGSNIASAEYNLDGGAWTAMAATDGAFDTSFEQVEATLTLAQPGVHTLCVRGTDAFSNTSPGECTTVTVAVSDIEVSPWELNFGDVTVGDSSFMMATISNLGGADLAITVVPPNDGAFDWSLVGTDDPYSATLPACAAPPDCPSVDLDVRFTPTAEQLFETTIAIETNDWDEPTVTVAVNGNGVAAEPPPQEAIQAIINFFDESVASCQWYFDWRGTRGLGAESPKRSAEHVGGSRGLHRSR